jgi:hypothetical protein
MEHPPKMSHLRVYTPTNIYGVPWLHLDKLQIMSWMFLGHHCIFTFVIFDYLLQPLNEFNKVFVNRSLNFFLSHAIQIWGLKFSTRDLLFSNDTILDRSSIRLVFYINICHYKNFIVLLIIIKIFVVNDVNFISSSNSQVMSCVLCHFAIVNVDVHNLAHKKSMKGLVRYNKYHNTSFLKKLVLELHSTKYTKWGLVQIINVIGYH